MRGEKRKRRGIMPRKKGRGGFSPATKSFFEEGGGKRKIRKKVGGKRKGFAIPTPPLKGKLIPNLCWEFSTPHGGRGRENRETHFHSLGKCLPLKKKR